MTQQAPASLDDVLVVLKGIREDVKQLFVRVQDAEERSNYAANVATKAYEASSKALQGVDGIKLDMSDIQAAMVRHAETVSQASSAIVQANAEQTPILESIGKSVATMRRYTPAMVAVATAVGTILGAIYHAFVASRGHG
jgi:hypothetical protein